ncbi:MAG: DUF3450 family protein [Pseudomonadota bacterium]
MHTRCLVVVIIIAPLQTAASPAEDIDGLTEQWIAIERQRSSIKANWIERSRIGQAQIELLQTEKASLEAFINSSALDENKIDAQRADLLREQRELEINDDALRRELDLVIDQLTVLHNRMPPPLHSSWIPHMVVLQDPDQELSVQLAALLSLLDDTAEFNERIALHQTRMSIGERELQVQQIYLGVSHGWYISEDGKTIGSGRALAEGWRWQDESDNPAFDPTWLMNTIDSVKAGAAMGLTSLPISIDPAP